MGSSQKLTFAGQDITQAPYNAVMTMQAKYWWLDGFTSTQYPTSATSLVNSKTYLKDWVITIYLRIISPDMTRATMQSSYNALAQLFNPLNGDQQLIFDEFPLSYFIAKGQKFAITKEDSAKHIIELEVDFACTGPPRSLSETVVSKNIATSPQSLPIFSLGDVQSSPRYRFTAAQAYTGNVTISNSVTNEQVIWNGALAAHDVLDFIMDVDYGTPYTVLHNGNLSISTIQGPAWPHIPPNDSRVSLMGPHSGTFEIRWRDRWLVGQQSLGLPTNILLSANYGTPSLGQNVTFNVQLNNTMGPMSKPIIVYHYTNGLRVDDFTATTDVNGQYSQPLEMGLPEDAVYYAGYSGDDKYSPSISSAVTVITRANSRLTFTVSQTNVHVNTNTVFSGQLQWWNPLNNEWETVPVPNEPIQLYYYPKSGGATVGPTTFFTDVSGNFTFNGNWSKIIDNVYYVYFPGDGVYGAAQSQNIEVSTYA